MVRLMSIAIIAILINVLIFTLIEGLVGGKRVRLSDAESVDIANFIRVTEQSREVRSRRDPSAPEKPAQDVQQELSRLADASNSGSGMMALDVPEFDVDLGPAVAGDIRIAREINPLVRVPPDYPQRALSQKIEGWVLLRFTVSETGTVEDPEVLRAEPAGLFERAAKRAVLRWKYQPQIRDGKPARVITLNRIVFRIDRSEGAQG